MTPEQRAQKQEMLDQARDALHQLLIGRQARVFVDQNGERVEYAVANADRLRAYIFELEICLGIKRPAPPLGFGF